MVKPLNSKAEVRDIKKTKSKPSVKGIKPLNTKFKHGKKGKKC